MRGNQHDFPEEWISFNRFRVQFTPSESEITFRAVANHYSKDYLLDTLQNKSKIVQEEYLK